MSRSPAATRGAPPARPASRARGLALVLQLARSVSAPASSTSKAISGLPASSATPSAPDQGNRKYEGVRECQAPRGACSGSPPAGSFAARTGRPPGHAGGRAHSRPDVVTTRLMFAGDAKASGLPCRAMACFIASVAIRLDGRRRRPRARRCLRRPEGARRKALGRSGHRPLGHGLLDPSAQRLGRGPDCLRDANALHAACNQGERLLALLVREPPALQALRRGRGLLR